MYRGIYRLSGVPASWRQHLLAACLSLGDEAAASHRAAARLWQLTGVEFGSLELSVPRGGRRRRQGLILHEVPLASIDVTLLDGIRTTSPTRTLIDLASVVSTDIVEEALDDALRRGLTSAPRLRWRLSELGRQGRSGISRIRWVIEQRLDKPGVPQSVLETRLLRLLKRAGLPLPECQYEVRERGRLLAILDFAYPDIRLAIEADGYRWHSGRVRWESDLARRNELTARGWRVLHVTWSDMERRPSSVIAAGAAAIAQP